MSSAASATKTVHEEQLARLHAEVAALRDQLHRAQRLAAVGTMTAMVAHEFNNILTPVVNYAQLAQKNPTLMGKAVARAADGGKRAATICNALLRMTREDPGRPGQIKAVELVNETLAIMGRDLARDSIDLKIDVAPDLTFTAARVELQQALLNLVLNARQALLAADAPRRMEISCRRDGTDVLIRVRDNGVGIPLENMERIFEPFFTTRHAEGPVGGDGASRGTGLGLAVCRQIVHALGGTISVDSQVSKGATFTVTLPAGP